VNFDEIIIVDWSAASKPGRGKDSIWIGQAGGSRLAPVNPATRTEAMEILRDRIAAARSAGRKVLIGADFPFGYPKGFAEALTGKSGALAVWEWLEASVEDGADNANNRFALADQINQKMGKNAPFWGRPRSLRLAHLPERGHDRGEMRFAERRRVEAHEPGTQPVWKLYTTGSVGSQALTGIARFAKLRAELGAICAVWPFENIEAAEVVFAEVWPSLMRSEVKAVEGLYPCRDAAQVDVLARALAAAPLAPLFETGESPEVLAEEGWILAAGKAELLCLGIEEPSMLTPPRLRNDCFAMPQGVEWIPVDAAQERLRMALVPLATTEVLPVAQAGGRALAADVVARRSNPARANSAVDGYAFAKNSLLGEGPYTLPLVSGRAAAGQPFAGVVGIGQAVRILTGAILPEGVDTVVLEEDCAIDARRVAFDGPIKARINTRKAGEDVAEGEIALSAGRRLAPSDLALLAALGIGEVVVRRPLRVAVLSTGDEIVAEAGAPALAHQIHDANRPMLLEMARRWGFAPVDLGHVVDDPEQIAARLDVGARTADVVLTSGGASAGDEDHVSHLLQTRGQLSSWRIAMKPGRPLAMALWQGVPVLGLPGNPVAAFVCALIFGYPALSKMAGVGWRKPQAFMVPAAFSKQKKAGRREYLRARMTHDGHAEVFASEGSGRISGLSWAEGLVELPDDAMDIVPGMPVHFLPFGSFGL
jgi:molybdopterin molybdotransferase